MKNNNVIVLGFILLSVVFAAGCTGGNAEAGADSGEDQANLEIKGSPGTEFSGSCTVGDGEPEEIGGQVPQSFTYTLNGKPLKCEIASENDVEVTFAHGNDRSVQRISGGTLNLLYKDGSISSSTSSSSTSSQITSSSGQAEENSGTTNVSGNVTARRET